MPRGKNSGGFTALEIIFVVVLIGILSGIAVKPMSGYLRRIKLQNAAEGVKHLIMATRSRAIANPSLHCGLRFVDAPGTTPDTVFAFLDKTSPSTYAYNAGQDGLYLKPYVLKDGTRLSGFASPLDIVFRGDGSADKSIGVKFTLGNFVDTLNVLASTGRVKTWVK